MNTSSYPSLIGRCCFEGRDCIFGLSGQGAVAEDAEGEFRAVSLICVATDAAGMGGGNSRCKQGLPEL